MGTTYITAEVACSRETGALNRTIERGTRAINFILSSMVFNIVPTILEVWHFTIFLMTSMFQLPSCLF